MINWAELNLTKDDYQAMKVIIHRVATSNVGIEIKPLDLRMSLGACHGGVCPLRLWDLAKAKLSDVLHDVLGIHRHLDKDTGTLRDCFCPRYAA